MRLEVLSIVLIVSIGLFSICRAKVESDVPKKMSMSEATKEALLKEKKEHTVFEKETEHYLENPTTKLDRECYARNYRPGQSIDFVIDLAPSPSQDKVDKMAAEESPMALFFQQVNRTASRAYFTAVQLFVDAVTLNMKPEWTHSVIYHEGRKYFIRGRHVEDVETLEKLQSQNFSDKSRNLKTLWPEPTKEVVSKLSSVVKNNLGRMTKLTLWNRDNGMPIVLAGSRRSRPIYTVVITDGSSGAKIQELTDDLWRTTVIDVGNRRFVKNLSAQEMERLAGVYSLTAPQQLPLLIDTIRFKACLFGEHATD